MIKRLLLSVIPVLAVAAYTMTPAAAQAAEPHYYANGVKIGSEAKPFTAWGTNTFTSLTSGLKVTCRTVSGGTESNPEGGGPGQGVTEAFSAYDCESEACSAPSTGEGSFITVTPENLPWKSHLVTEGSTIRSENTGVKLTVSCHIPTAYGQGPPNWKVNGNFLGLKFPKIVKDETLEHFRIEWFHKVIYEWTVHIPTLKLIWVNGPTLQELLEKGLRNVENLGKEIGKGLSKLEEWVSPGEENTEVTTGEEGGESCEGAVEMHAPSGGGELLERGGKFYVLDTGVTFTLKLKGPKCLAAGTHQATGNLEGEWNNATHSIIYPSSPLPGSTLTSEGKPVNVRGTDAYVTSGETLEVADQPVPEAYIQVSEKYTGANKPKVGKGTSALHPGFLEFDSGSGELELEGGGGKAKLEGKIKLLGFEESELLNAKAP